MNRNHLAMWRSGDVAIEESSAFHKRLSPIRQITGSLNRSFSLIELMVAVGIITLLVGLTVAITTSVSANAERREAEDIIRLLQLASDEYERLAERPITYGWTVKDAQGNRYVHDLNEFDYGWIKDRDKALLPRKFLSFMLHNTQSAAIINKINEKRVKRDNEGDPYSSRYVVDPWGTIIRVIFAGRKWNPNLDPPDALANRDPDGTIRTEEETIFGICVNGKINFVSYGPDGKPGTLQLDKEPNQRDEARVMQAADNVCAYPPLRERPVLP